MKSKNSKSKAYGRAWLKKAGYKHGFEDRNPNSYTQYACFMNSYKLGQMRRLLENDNE